MKRIIAIAPAVICSLILLSACKHSGSKSVSSDSTASQPLPRPASNSDATNPSLADTPFAKTDTAHVPADSVKR